MEPEAFGLARRKKAGCHQLLFKLLLRMLQPSSFHGRLNRSNRDMTVEV